MTKLTQEIHNTIDKLTCDISEEAAEELKWHLHELLEMKRNRLKTESDDTPGEKESDIGERWAHALSLAIQHWNKKPLTKECLIGGGWFMRSATEEDRDALKSLGLPVSLSAWGSSRDDACCAVLRGVVVVGSIEKLPMIGENLKEIFRIGGNFYLKAD